MFESIILILLCGLAIATIIAIPYLLFLVSIKLKTLICRENISKFIDYVSAEWIFNFFPNGGTAVALRTFFVGSLICTCLYAAHDILSWSFTPPTSIIDNNMYKILGIYAAVYAAFYARFVSQWTYLSNLYNSIREQEINIQIQYNSNSSNATGTNAGAANAGTANAGASNAGASNSGPAWSSRIAGRAAASSSWSATTGRSRRFSMSPTW